MLELDGLDKRYGDVVALDGVTFSVPPGRTCGFVGPNGAGKTTAMRIVLGVLEPDAGAVRWRGRAVDAATRRRFGYMPEERGLYPKMRVRDQLTYFARLHCVAVGAAVQAADRWIDRLGLGERAGDRVEELSLGNQQRVQLGVALVHDPDVLVLDEPFSGLDPVGVDVMSGVLRERADAGVPVVFSSHQLELVERLCEDVVIVNRGRLVAAGGVEELRERGRSEREHVRVRIEGDGGGAWLAGVPGAAVAETATRRPRSPGARRGPRGGARRRVCDRDRDALQPRAPDARRSLPLGGGYMSGRAAVALVARREITQRVREKTFLVSTLVTLVVIACVAVLPSLLGFGGKDEFTIAVADPGVRPVADAAVRAADAFDAKLRVVSGDADATLARGRIRAQKKPDDKLLHILQAANAREQSAAALRAAGLDDRDASRALSPPPLALTTVEPVDTAAEKRSGFAFFAVLLLYGQLIGMGYLVAMGVVEEKSSRVVELLLATLRPRHLLAGKILGLGLLGLGQLLLLAVLGLGVAGASGSLTIDGDLLVAAGLALVWFVVGYAFYAAAFACAASLVSRQEDLQSVLTPLTMMLMVGFFLSFAVADDPGSTLATVVSFILPAAPMTMPPRIALGEASAGDIVAALAVTLGAAALLVPLAARIYSGAVRAPARP